MLQMIRDDHIRQLSAAPGLAALEETAFLQDYIYPDLMYHIYNEAIKAEAGHFGLPNAHFTTHGVLIGAATAQFTKTRPISAIKLARGLNS